MGRRLTLSFFLSVRSFGSSRGCSTLLQQLSQNGVRRARKTEKQVFRPRPPETSVRRDVRAGRLRKPRPVYFSILLEKRRHQSDVLQRNHQETDQLNND